MCVFFCKGTSKQQKKISTEFIHWVVPPSQDAGSSPPGLRTTFFFGSGIPTYINLHLPLFFWKGGTTQVIQVEVGSLSGIPPGAGFQSPPGLHDIFRIGNPNLNYKPLFATIASWEGGSSKVPNWRSNRRVFPGKIDHLSAAAPLRWSLCVPSWASLWVWVSCWESLGVSECHGKSGGFQWFISWKTLWTNGWFGGLKPSIFGNTHLGDRSIPKKNTVHKGHGYWEPDFLPVLYL